MAPPHFDEETHMADSVNSTSSMVPGQQGTLGAVQAQLIQNKGRMAQGPANQVRTGQDARAAATAQAATAAAVTAATTSSNIAPKTTAQSEAETARALDVAVRHLQDYFAPDQNVSMEEDHDSGQSYVKIVDAKTKQLILQIPSAEVLAMARKLQEMANPQSASGVLVDQEG
jgi:uncharacterized FlaG/YvyC family protein